MIPRLPGRRADTVTVCPFGSSTLWGHADIGPESIALPALFQQLTARTSQLQSSILQNAAAAAVSSQVASAASSTTAGSKSKAQSSPVAHSVQRGQGTRTDGEENTADGTATHVEPPRSLVEMLTMSLFPPDAAALDQAFAWGEQDAAAYLSHQEAVHASNS